jgi:hypothetical protein
MPNSQTEAAAMGCSPRITPIQDVKELRAGPPGDWVAPGYMIKQATVRRPPSLPLARTGKNKPAPTSRDNFARFLILSTAVLRESNVCLVH